MAVRERSSNPSFELTVLRRFRSPQEVNEWLQTTTFGDKQLALFRIRYRPESVFYGERTNKSERKIRLLIPSLHMQRLC
jgi:hypothetical protein